MSKFHSEDQGPPANELAVGSASEVLRLIGRDLHREDKRRRRRMDTTTRSPGFSR
jgi:hypothetical protein